MRNTKGSGDLHTEKTNPSQPLSKPSGSMRRPTKVQYCEGAANGAGTILAPFTWSAWHDRSRTLLGLWQFGIWDNYMYIIYYYMYTYRVRIHPTRWCRIIFLTKMALKWGIPWHPIRSDTPCSEHSAKLQCTSVRCFEATACDSDLTTDFGWKHLKHQTID